MKRILVIVALMGLGFGAQNFSLGAQDFSRIPRAWKWIGASEAIFSYDGSYEDEGAFSVQASGLLKKGELYKKHNCAPEKYSQFPLNPEGAVNLTYSPDSTKLAFTRDNDIYVVDIASEVETRLTFDGTDLILNGYSSWVYYEEILGRPTKYRAFWWSPDSQKIGFYRFDNTQVTFFPIYSPFGQDGTLLQTRYPKAGEVNPEVKVGIIDLASDAASKVAPITWADFNPSDDQYFGIPFWSDDSSEFYIAHMGRVQNKLDLYAVDAKNGSKRHVYHEEYSTWIDWISEIIFAENGLYMVRPYETLWDQIYFLPYNATVAEDGQVQGLKRLTDGHNWRMSLVDMDSKGNIYFTAERDSRVSSALYKVDPKGRIVALTDPNYHCTGVKISPDGKYFVASVSNAKTPTKIVLGSTAKMDVKTVSDQASETFDPSSYALAELIWLTTEDGFELPAQIVFPFDFDPSKQYPVHVDIYGGPNVPEVYDRWRVPTEKNQWYSHNGIIQVIADSRAAGHSGLRGTDMEHCNLIEYPVKDFVAWAEYLQSLPYVKGDKIGVEGFSFGGTMTAMLLFTQSQAFHYGIAGGGVYDWMLYDTHYTERFMDTPWNNAEGYEAAKVLNYASEYPVVYGQNDGSVMLKITHGTADDNVHFQNTLQLIDELHKGGKEFEFMIYPDGMHGYRGYQGSHFTEANHAFWLKYLKGE